MNKTGQTALYHKLRAVKTAVLLLLATTIAGCSRYSDEPTTANDDGDYISLRMTIPFSVGSRTDTHGHTEEDSTYPSFENFINPNDIGIFIFLGESDDAPRIEKWTLLSKSQSPTTSLTNVGSHYVITLKMTRASLKEADPNWEVGPNSTDVIKFRTVVLANEGIKKYKSPNANPKEFNENNYSDYDGCKTYKSLIDKAYTTALGLGTNYYPEKKDQLNSLIPMFGVNVFEVKGKDLYFSAPDDIIDLGEILLLRSFVKVRLVDKTKKDPSGRFPEISCVNSDSVVAGTHNGLAYRYRKAYNLPLDALTYRNGWQVDDIHLCTQVVYDRLSNVGEIVNTDKKEPGVIYSTYCPEQLVDKTSTGVQYPQFTFMYRDRDLRWKSQTVLLDGTELPTDKDGKSRRGLIRNHVYTLTVTNETTKTNGNVGRSGSGNGDIQVTVSESEF